MSDSVLTSVFGQVLLVDDAVSVARKLQRAYRSLQLTDGEAVAEKLTHSLTPGQYARLQDWVTEAQTTLADAARMQTVLAAAQRQLENLPLMTITAAIAVNRAAALKIVRWLERAGPGPLKLELAYDPEIVGGAVIEWQGKRSDYSLAKKLDDKYIAAKI
jgi:hypothetical protein